MLRRALIATQGKQGLSRRSIAYDRPWIFRSAKFSVISDAQSTSMDDTVIREVLPSIADSEFPLGPINLLLKGVIEFHEVTELPWWLTIAAFASIFRVCAMPFVISMKQNGARLGYARNDLQKAQDKAVLIRGDPNASQEDKINSAQEISAVFQKHKCNPLSTIASVLIQLPLYSVTFFAVRRLCTQFEDTRYGGLEGYFLDLSVADPSHILGPIVSGVMILSVYVGTSDAQMANNSQDDKGQQMQHFVRLLAYGAGCAMIPVSFFMPSGLLVYILSTSSTAFVLNLSLKIPFISKYLGIHPDFLPGKLEDDRIMAQTKPSKPLVAEKPRK